MKKTLSIILTLILCFSLLAGCKTQTENNNAETETNAKVVNPLPETIDVKKLDNRTVAVSLADGDVYVDDNGKMQMKVTVFAYDMYDMVDIASLNENDVIIRKNEEVKVTELERLDSGLVRINGGEENGGFDLVSNDSTVYYETGMNDIKAYYEIGMVTLPVSDEFEYIDESVLDSEAKTYYPGDPAPTGGRHTHTPMPPTRPPVAAIHNTLTPHTYPPPHTHTHTHTHTHGRTLSTHATPPGHVTDTPHMPHPPPHPAPLCVFLSPLFLLPSSVVVPLPLAPLPPPSQDRVPLR